MSRIFKTKEEALNHGFYLAGREELQKDTIELMLEQDKVCSYDKVFYDFSGEPLPEQTAFSFENCYDKPVQIASSKFRDGYDLWIGCEFMKFCRRVSNE